MWLVAVAVAISEWGNIAKGLRFHGTVQEEENTPESALYSIYVYIYIVLYV